MVRIERPLDKQGSQHPVIEATTQTIFLVAKSKENCYYVQRLHAPPAVRWCSRLRCQATAVLGATLPFGTLWEN